MHKPLVSIGMPVYNGEAFLQRTLDSLLAQNYENIEFHISDNASTDGTQDICRSYLTKDRRVHYYRSSKNIGQLPNFQRALELASGDYFMWAACDDSWSANYVETLVQCLLACPNAAFAAGKTLFIDENGRLLSKGADDAPPSYPNSPVVRAKQLLAQHAVGWLHGVYRKRALLTQLPTLLEKNPWGSDLLFLLEMCLRYEATGSDEAIMFKRLAQTNTSHGSVPRTPRQVVAWQCWFAWELSRSIVSSDLRLAEKRQLLATCSRYLRRLYFWEGTLVWTKVWIRAGCHRFIGVDRT